MRDAILEIQDFVRGMSEDDFYRDNKTKYAVEKLLTVIGEAAARVSKETQQDSRWTEWKKAIGLRNKLVHEYHKVDYVTVYQVVKKDLPLLQAEVNRVIDEMEKLELNKE